MGVLADAAIGHDGGMTQYRAVFDAAVSFANGGGIQAQAFRVDVPGPEVTEDEVARLFTVSLDLLMTESVQISNLQIVHEAHRGTRGGPSDDGARSAAASVEERCAELTTPLDINAGDATPLTDGAVVRPARPGDEDPLLAAIVALAEYEREADSVKNTTALIRRALFDENPNAFAHVVERDGEIVGVAIWFLTYSTWTGRHGIWLEDLFVYQSERGRGYGLALIRELAAICLKRGYPRLEWTVLDWNTPSIDFYRSIGAEPLDEWTTQRVTGEALERLGGGQV